ncbi:MAG: hypothetical protein ACFWT6_00685 [Virgibacillus proomii]|jgi:DnaK suppressor protein
MKTYLSQDKLLAFKDRLLQMKKETEDALEANTNSEPNENLQKFANCSNHPADMDLNSLNSKKSWFFANS